MIATKRPAAISREIGLITWISSGWPLAARRGYTFVRLRSESAISIDSIFMKTLLSFPGLVQYPSAILLMCCISFFRSASEKTKYKKYEPLELCAVLGRQKVLDNQL